MAALIGLWFDFDHSEQEIKNICMYFLVSLSFGWLK